jgi:dihydroorotase/N-acyl-D-amino-acid deacylase
VISLAAALAVAVAAEVATAGREASGPEGSYDVIVAGGRVVDGSGNPWYRADVGIRGRKIAAIGDLSGAAAARRVDARDRVVAPGFVDMSGGGAIELLVDPRAASKLTQGITLVVAGEGTTVAPAVPSRRPDSLGVVRDWSTFAEYFRRLEAARPAVNLASYVGSSTVREHVVGLEDRPPTARELAAMQGLVAQAMEDGAIGLSSILQDPPDRFNRTEELVALARVAARHGGLYSAHQRSEGDAIEASLAEMFRIAREAAARVHLFHLKLVYVHNWGAARKIVERIEQARASGLDITADVYPYTRAGGSFKILLPPWVHEGGAGRRDERLRDPALRARIKKELEAPSPEWENEYFGAGGAQGFVLTGAPTARWRPFVGRTLAEAAESVGRDPRDVLFDIVLDGDAGFTSGITDESDMRVLLPRPWVSYQNDAGIRALDGPLSGGRPHPRAFGTVPRILGRYTRELGLMTLEEAVRKGTSLAARTLGIRDRGLLREGFYADIVVFDPDTIVDRATYDEARYSEGIDYVLVNGAVVLAGGALTGARPGMAVRGPGYRPAGAK